MIRPGSLGSIANGPRFFGMSIGAMHRSSGQVPYRGEERSRRMLEVPSWPNAPHFINRSTVGLESIRASKKHQSKEQHLSGSHSLSVPDDLCNEFRHPW